MKGQTPHKKIVRFGGCFYYYGKMGDFDVYTAKPKVEGSKSVYWKPVQFERDCNTASHIAMEFRYSVGDGKVRKVPFWE